MLWAFFLLCSASADLTPGAGGPGWRPGAESLSLRPEEVEIQPREERLASCDFKVVNAKEANFTEVLLANLHMPMLVTGMLDTWGALEEWNKESITSFLKSMPPGTFAVNSWNISAKAHPMQDAPTQSHSPSQLKTPADYFDLWNEKTPAGNYKEPNAIIHKTNFENKHDLFRNAKTPKEMEAFSTARQLALNAFGTGHGIHRHPEAWLAQVRGHKSWYMFPPVPEPAGTWWELTEDDTHFGFPHEEQPILQNTVCGYRPLRKLYKDNLKFCVQAPGEVVYIPDFYWHSTCALDEVTIASGGFLNSGCEGQGKGACDKLMTKYDSAVPKKRPKKAPHQGIVVDSSPMGAIPLRDGVMRRLGTTDSVGPEMVFKAVDEYCWTENKMYCVGMAIGDIKGKLLEEIVQEWMKTQPPGQRKGIEFGSLLGYSAIRIAKHLPAKSQFFAVEPRYKEAEIKETADKLLAWAGMDKSVQFLSQLSFQVIDAFKAKNAVWDIVSIDHVKEDYLNCLKQLEDASQLRIGSLVIADNVILFSITNLLQHMRFSGSFVDYRLYYSEAEYDEYHGKPSPRDGIFELMPDGIAIATWAGKGKGKVYESPNASACADFPDCSACLSNLCSWCPGDGCVPEVKGKTCKDGAPALGIFGDMKCSETWLRPGEWVGPQDDAGNLRRGADPQGARYGRRIEQRRPREGQIEASFHNALTVPVQVFFVPPDAQDSKEQIPIGEILPGKTLFQYTDEGHGFVFKADGKVLSSHTVSASGEQHVRITKKHDEL